MSVSSATLTLAFAAPRLAFASSWAAIRLPPSKMFQLNTTPSDQVGFSSSWLPP